MKQETKDRLMKAATIAAMVTPPWNIFWWTVGGILYYAKGGRKWDTSGYGALGMVLGAPITLPLMPFMLIKERIELRQYERQQAKYNEVALWISVRLKKYGILVTEAGPTLNGAKVVATVDPLQEGAYGNVVAQAVREFAGVGLTADQVCSNAEPLHPLGEAWGKQHGLDAWAEEVFTAACEDCGVQESIGWRFGKTLAYCKAMQSQMRHSISLPDKSERIVNGHICRTCLDKLGWKGMSSGCNWDALPKLGDD